MSNMMDDFSKQMTGLSEEILSHTKHCEQERDMCLARVAELNDTIETNCKYRSRIARAIDSLQGNDETKPTPEVASGRGISRLDSLSMPNQGGYGV